MEVAFFSPSQDAVFKSISNRDRWGNRRMIEWLLLPALVLIVVLTIVTAKPKPPGPGDGDRSD
jgi:hypothetical protein